mgnify:CR=1 FL=1|jgi:hypothetical protein
MKSALDAETKKNLQKEKEAMPKDSQIDPKEVRRAKSKGGPTPASDQPDNEGRNAKKHSIQSQGHQQKK